MRIIVIVIPLLILVMIGCSQDNDSHVGGSSLDDEISRLPDTWSASWRFGASSNNWAILNRVAGVKDIQERIRLINVLQNHFRHQPQQIVAECGKDYKMRIAFIQACIDKLIGGKGVGSHEICAGWKLQASLLDDLERIMELTVEAWNGGKENIYASTDVRNKWRLAYDVRRQYELYFKYSFCIGESFRMLPDHDRPAFVLQIRRDFFNRPGMKYVDSSAIPDGFK